MVTKARRPTRRPLVVAHRGGSPADVDNSLAAFQHALAIGADLIECDLRRASDGTIVLYHDERIGGERVSSLTVQELRRRIPTLLTFDDLLMLTTGTSAAHRLTLDLKERGIEQELIPILEQRPDVLSRVLISTVHTSSLRRLAERFPNLRLALSRGHLMGSLPDGFSGLVARILRPLFPIWLAPQLRWCRAGAVALHHALIDKRTVARYRGMGYRVYAWTVDDGSAVERLAEAGVDLVATNVPQDILGFLGRLPETK